MIVAETTDGFRFISLPNHSQLTGQIARHWGNETFATPAPNHSMSIAAEQHDQHILAPSLHPDEARPIGFREYPGEKWATSYRSGVETTLDIDPYAGLVVSLHGSGLRKQGYGVRRDIPEMEDKPVYDEFIEEQEKLQKETMVHLRGSDRFSPYIAEDDLAFLNELHETGEYSGHCRTWHNYLLFEVYDSLALYFCENDTLRETTIGPVPMNYTSDEDTTDLTISPIDETEVRIDPYPFAVSPIPFTVSGRFVPKTFETQDQLTERYYERDREHLEFTVRDG